MTMVPSIPRQPGNVPAANSFRPAAGLDATLRSGLAVPGFAMLVCAGAIAPRRSSPMIRTLGLVALLLMIAGLARAQDVQGIELCTHETRMDRRTGCLQSNIEYLQGVITKNAADARQRLAAAAGEIAALKQEIAALKGDLAATRAALAALQARVEKPDAAKPAVKSDKPSDKPAPPGNK
jgi:septal ring factor EnvC (AmiA/AmiB activator)